MMRPSGSCAAPSQNTLSGASIVLNVVGVPGFQTSVGSGCCHPSQKMKVPLSIKMELMATIGNVISEPHWPCGSELGVTGTLTAEGMLVPVALVAVTVNV